MEKFYEVLAKGIHGVRPPNSTCTTYPLMVSRVWANSKKHAEEIFATVHEGEYAEIFHKDTKEIEPTAEELAAHICGGKQ